MKVLFTNQILNYDSLILRNNFFDIIVSIYGANSRVKISEKVKDEIRSIYKRNLNKLKNSGTENLLFFKNGKNSSSIMVLVELIKLNIEKKYGDQNIEYFNYGIDGIDLIEKRVNKKINIEIDGRFIGTKIIQNLYESKDTKKRRKESISDFIQGNDFNDSLFDELFYQFSEKEDLSSYRLSQLSSIQSVGGLSESQFIKILSLSKETTDIEKDILESFIQEIDLKRYSFSLGYDFDRLFLDFFDEETKNSIEKNFDSCHQKRIAKDKFFEDQLNRVKETGYIHYGFIGNFITNKIKEGSNLRDAYLSIKDFFDEFVVGGFEGINASFSILFFKFSDDKIFRFEEVSDYGVKQSFVDFLSN